MLNMGTLRRNTNWQKPIFRARERNSINWRTNWPGFCGRRAYSRDRSSRFVAASHADYSLSEGEVIEEDCEIECWKHGSTFSLETGEPQSFPATKPVPVYEVVVEGDDVSVVLP